ncbi:MAG: ATP phosphoribosyltransferase regulatory subunit, partial [Clostridiales bacterium]|nr:ATP phosphoribosyltransferase regulatory subunit [Clostridiales bacterium]
MGNQRINTKPPSGCMELLPEEQIEFDRIKNIIESTYTLFGFSALDTPVIERTETLLAKEDSETETEARKNLYLVKNRNAVFNDREVDLGLRFDLTVPLARYVSEHLNDLSFPFRRFHIAKVYRGERAAKGRFREFYQCDIDVIGRNSLSVKYDAEIPFIIYTLFKKLDFGKFTIKINNRKILNGILESLGVPDESYESVLNIIDEIEKIRYEEFH